LIHVDETRFGMELPAAVEMSPGQIATRLAVGAMFLLTGAGIIVAALATAVAAERFFPGSFPEDRMIRRAANAVRLPAVLGGAAIVLAGWIHVLVRYRITAAGLERRILGLKSTVPWRRVWRVSTVPDGMDVRAGRLNVRVPWREEFHEEYSQLARRCWRRALAGSGRRELPLDPVPGSLGVPRWACSAALVALIWAMAACAVQSQSMPGILTAVLLIGAAGIVAYILADAWSSARAYVTVDSEGLTHRGALRARRVALSEVICVQLAEGQGEPDTLDAPTRRPPACEIVLFSEGTTTCIRTTRSAGRFLVRLLDRGCPEAFVVERDRGWLLLPTDGLDHAGIRDRMQQIVARFRTGALLRAAVPGLVGAGMLAAGVCVFVLFPPDFETILNAISFLTEAVSFWSVALRQILAARNAKRSFEAFSRGHNSQPAGP